MVRKGLQCVVIFSACVLVGKYFFQLLYFYIPLLILVLLSGWDLANQYINGDRNSFVELLFQALE